MFIYEKERGIALREKEKKKGKEIEKDRKDHGTLAHHSIHKNIKILSVQNAMGDRSEGEHSSTVGIVEIILEMSPGTKLDAPATHKSKGV